MSLGKCPCAAISNSLLFELFSVTTTVIYLCYMNMQNKLQTFLTTLMDSLMKLKQRLDKFNENKD